MDSSLPFVSVLMPAYNAKLYIKDAIESILSQSFTNFELIIINDGSTDDTLDILNSFTDKRIKIIDNVENKGLIYTLNKGLKIAKGKYIARMDSDDIAYPSRIQKQVDFLEQNNNISLVGTAFIFMNTKNEVHHPLFHEGIKIKLIENTAFAHPSVMFRRSDFEDKGLFYDPAYECAEDYKLWTDVVRVGLKTANIDDVLLEYRIHGEQISSAKSQEQKKKTEKIRIDYLCDIINDQLSSDYHVAVSKGLFNDHPRNIIKTLLYLRVLINQKKCFDPDLFDLFIKEKIDSIVPVMGRQDIKYLLYQNFSFKYRLSVFKKYIGLKF